MNVLDFIFPKRCLECGRFGKYFCDFCRRTVRTIKSNEAICPVCEKPAIDGWTHPGCRTRYTPDGLTSFFRYDGIIRKAVKALKYRLVTDLAAEFVSLVPDSSFFFYHPREGGDLRSSKQIPDQVGNDRMIMIPIPLHPSRFCERGFNQAEVLGKLVFEKYGIPMRTDILSRVKRTTPQVEMKDRKKRLENMEHVFSVPDACSKPAPGPHERIPDAIVLFDDVFTTGATMRSAANVLKRSGVTFIWAVTTAR